MRIPFKYKSATATVNMVETDYGVVCDVYAKHRRLGHATGLMKAIVDWADQYDIVLSLAAQTYGNADDPSNQELIEFYGRFGFSRHFRSDVAPWPAHLVRPASQKLQGP